MTIANSRTEIAALFERVGPVVDLSTASRVLGVSRERVNQLYQAGDLGGVVLDGRRMVSWGCVECRAAYGSCTGRCNL